MSADVSSEHVCYVHCNFCNTILAVSVPSSSLYNVVTVRCGYCANLLSVNMGALLHSIPLQDLQFQNNQGVSSEDSSKDGGSSSKGSKVSTPDSIECEQSRMIPICSPEKRQRVPSAYNKFIKEEIQRIKANNPEISHREAFSTAAKNTIKAFGLMDFADSPSWGIHYPNYHFRSSSSGPGLSWRT